MNIIISLSLRYITVLVEMTRFEGTRQGHLIAGQMLDVTIRVKNVRPFAIKQMVLNCPNHYNLGHPISNGSPVPFILICPNFIRQPSWKTLIYSLGIPRRMVFVKSSMQRRGSRGNLVDFFLTPGGQLMLY